MVGTKADQNQAFKRLLAHAKGDRTVLEEALAKALADHERPDSSTVLKYIQQILEQRSRAA